jgi:hypothetical protein
MLGVLPDWESIYLVKFRFHGSEDLGGFDWFIHFFAAFFIGLGFMTAAFLATVFFAATFLGSFVAERRASTYFFN